MANTSIQNTQLTQLQNYGQVSGTVTFANSPGITNEYFIHEAYSRLGITAETLSDMQVKNALRGMNFILTKWMNLGYFQWTRRKMMLAVIPGRSVYSVVDLVGNTMVSDISEISLRTQIRMTQLTNAPVPNMAANGVAFSSSGTASNAFDGSLTTACAQGAANGYIGFNFNGGSATSQAAQFSGVTMVGVMSAVAANYTLAVQTSTDGITYATIKQFTTLNFPAYETVWLDIAYLPTGQYIQIVETSGATLNVTELYFSGVQCDTLMTRLSQSEYNSLSTKTTTSGQPNQYYFAKELQPLLYIWPFPNTNTPTVTELNNPSAVYGYSSLTNSYILLISYFSYSQDVGALYNTLCVPPRFYEAFLLELVVNLCYKEQKLDAVQLFSQELTVAFSNAKAEDMEKVPMRFTADPYNNGGSWIW